MTPSTGPEIWHRKPIKPIVVRTIIPRDVATSVEEVLRKLLAEDSELPGAKN
jgi:hypothetical protein